MSSYLPHRLARFFCRLPLWQAEIGPDELQITVEHAVTRIDYCEICQLDIVAGWFWSGCRITTNSQVHFLKGLTRARANALIQVLSQRIQQAVSEELNIRAAPVLALQSRLESFLAMPCYLAHGHVEAWIKHLDEETTLDWHRLRRLLSSRFINARSANPALAHAVPHLQDLFAGPREGLRQRNNYFIHKEMAAHAEFFDQVESSPLTEEQRAAAIVMEDRNLLIAAAGSGKSATLVAKIGYALRTGQFQPEDILAVVFNRNAREELEARLKERLPETGSRVSARTFHKLGKDILAEVFGKQPTPAPWEDSPQTSAAFMTELIASLLEERSFLQDWVMFRSVCAQPNRELDSFKTPQDYDHYVREVGQEREGQRGILTLNGEMVKSMEEMAIANWLYLQGVSYQYERPYQYETANREYRQYAPDFYYPDADLYHEHFALDDQGKAPAIFRGDYEAGVLWKRALHQEKSTRLIETTSAQYRQGQLFAHLEQVLQQHGVRFQPRSSAEVLERLNQKSAPLAPFLKTFLTHLKANGWTPDDLITRAKRQRDQWRTFAFLRVLAPIRDRYEAKLKAGGYIDYEDMVRNAAELVTSGQYVHPYRLILVDEFQDISQSGAALIKAMLQQNPDCKLFAVGDDWQSINRFAGADITLMTGFAQHFGAVPAQTAMRYLTRTFRSNQGITDVAASFVQANPGQYQKTVTATDSRSEQVICFVEYDRDEAVPGVLEQQLHALVNQASLRNATQFGQSAKHSEQPVSVFVLARYNHLKPTNLGALQVKFAGRLTIAFKSMHRSKGLEADYVIILGLNAGTAGFPSQIEDDPLLDLVMPARETFPMAEERRLFYVALTRARHGVIALTRKSKVSRFVTELLAPSFRDKVKYGEAVHAPAKACPACGVGVLREKHGKYGWFLGCSTYPVCGMTESIRDGGR